MASEKRKIWIAEFVKGNIKIFILYIGKSVFITEVAYLFKIQVVPKRSVQFQNFILKKVIGVQQT